MGRRKLEINRKKFEKAIKQAEKDGPLSNRSELWEKVAAIYNQMDVPDPLSHSVVYLRVKEWEITVKTPVGKCGRAAGPMTDEQKAKIAESRKNRKSKAEKFSSDEDAQAHFENLKKNTPERFWTLIDKIAKGSRTAAVKLNCLQCMGFVTKDVKTCTASKICSMWLFRPYQTKEEAAEFDADGGNDPDEEVTTAA